MEIAVRKATRLDYNPPKRKHLDTLVSLTFHNPAIISNMLEMLERRHRENSWIISFKVLIIFHVLMREGNDDRAAEYIKKRPSALDTTRLREKSSGVVHIQNIYVYTAYLEQKVAAYRELGVDYIHALLLNKEGYLRHLTVSNGLLRQTQVLQKQMSTLLRCQFILDDVDNTISLYAFQLVVKDLLTLFQATNEAVVNILEHYFAMNRPDARTSLDIYKRFSKQTEDTIQFLDRAKQMQHELDGIQIPDLKHAPLSLADALEEYLADLGSSGSPALSDHAKPVPTMTVSTPLPTSPRSTSPGATSPRSSSKPRSPPVADLLGSLDDERALVLVPVTSHATGPPMVSKETNPFRQSTNPFRNSTLYGPRTSYMFPYQWPQVRDLSTATLSCSIPTISESSLALVPVRTTKTNDEAAAALSSTALVPASQTPMETFLSPALTGQSLAPHHRQSMNPFLAHRISVMGMPPVAP